MSRALDKRVTDLEQRAGTPGSCARRLRICVVYDDMPMEGGDMSPAPSASGSASPLCPHGRPWQGVDVEVEDDHAG